MSSRTQSSIKNLITALIGQMAGIIISILARIVFLHYLNEEYLGLNGLFTNILTIFSLVELGIGPAMNFSLYKPLAEKNTEQIKSLMRLYKRAYIGIGFAIAVISVIFIPFYTVFMDEVPDIPNLTLIYVLFAGNSVISYFFSYKRALIICDEKRYIATIFRYSFFFALNVIQIIILITTHNYILFLTAQLLCTFLENVAVSYKADKLYPFLKEKNVNPLSKETSTEIKKNVFAMIFHKIGGIVVFSTDNIILSKVVGLTAVGLYSNYYLITDALNKIINQVFSSIVASVGNLNAIECEKNTERLEAVFNRVFFLNFWIFGFSSSCLITLFNPFISLWVGSEYTFDIITVTVISINFFLTGIRKSALTFREATGVFYYDRYKPLFECVINIIASVILAEYIGTTGVFLGTIISTISAPLWVEPYVLYKHIFHKSMKFYMLKLLLYTTVTTIASAATFMISQFVSMENQLAGFILKFLISLIIPNLIFILIFFKSKDFKYFVELISKIFNKIKTTIRKKYDMS